MKTIHANLKITEAEFDRSWSYLEKTLAEAKIKKDLVEEVKFIFYSFKDDVVTIYWTYTDSLWISRYYQIASSSWEYHPKSSAKQGQLLLR